MYVLYVVHVEMKLYLFLTVKPATVHNILQIIHKSLMDLELKQDQQQADLAVKFVAKATTSFFLHLKVWSLLFLSSL